MTYWRMQLHPNESDGAIKHTVDSLSAGYIGLDFASDVPDLLTVTQAKLPDKQRHYWGFAHDMEIGDRVLVFAHHFPFALAKVAGDYNYVRAAVPALGVWFRHFRLVDDVRYFGDFTKNAHDWESINTPLTIQPLRSPKSKSYRLIDAWLNGTVP